jgi:predicted aldo/keto reductase-like oxidoreductase
MAVNELQNSMAVHVLAHLAIKNLKRWVWTREEVESWLLGMDRETQQQVRDKMNEVLKVSKQSV